MIGALMHATIFGHVTNIVHRSFARRSEYDSKWSDLKQFTELHNMPKQLKQRMQDYFQSVWSINNGIDVTEVKFNLVTFYFPFLLAGCSLIQFIYFAEHNIAGTLLFTRLDLMKTFSLLAGPLLLPRGAPG